MLNTYIKNRGITQSIVYNNNRGRINETNWNADYDGNVANIDINTNTNGRHNHFGFQLNNDDLENLLNRQSIDIPIDKRLEIDFIQPNQLINNSLRSNNHFSRLNRNYSRNNYSRKHKARSNYVPSIEELYKATHISSPSSKEELIIPMTIDKNTMDNYTLTPRRKHRRMKTHISHKVYKKHKITPRLHRKSRKYHHHSF